VSACIHGVDRNPLAIELTKVALWIETVETGKPLGFLDANIRCGDSLLGVFDLDALRYGIPDVAYRPLAGDDTDTARYFQRRNRDERAGQGDFDFARGGGRLPVAAPLAAETRSMRAMPEDSLEEITAKRQRFQASRADPKLWALQIPADLYTAAFLLPKTSAVPTNRSTVTIPTTRHVWEALAGRAVYGPLVGRAQDIAGAAHAFHWPLEFSDIMAAGGFDVVLGNPPWERVKLQEREFFAAREPEIADAPNAAARGRRIAKLKDAEPGSRDRTLYQEFETAKRVAEAASIFSRVPSEDGGRFPLTGRGDVNNYALFAELFASLVSARGRAGMIVPTQVATADTTKRFFNSLVGNRRLVSFFNFFEIRQWFVATDDRNPFGLLTIGSYPRDPEFAFWLTAISQLSEVERRFTLSADDIARINPNTKTAPVFRSRADARLTAKIYGRVPVLIDEAKGGAGNPWGVSFMRMFDMSNDSGLFRTAAQLHAEGYERDGADWAASDRRPRYVPLYEAKMIHQFDHRWATYDGGETRDATAAEKPDPDFEPTPRYWVPDDELKARLAAKGWTRDWVIGSRDIARATDERTVIAAPFPRVGVGNNLPLMLFMSEAEPQTLVALLCCLSSLVCDFSARYKVGGTHLNYFVYEQLPVLPPSTYTAPDLTFIMPRVLELTYTSHSMASFACDLGYRGSPFAWDEHSRALLRADLDAWYARAYGLTRDELCYVLDPADVMGPEYPSETFRVLKKSEIDRYGEYRTARLVLAAWDAQEARLAAAQ